MKGSTTSSTGKHRQPNNTGGSSLFRDQAQSQAADVDKWGHDLYENILHEEKEMQEKRSVGSKKSQDQSSHYQNNGNAMGGSQVQRDGINSRNEGISGSNSQSQSNAGNKEGHHYSQSQSYHNPSSSMHHQNSSNQNQYRDDQSTNNLNSSQQQQYHNNHHQHTNQHQSQSYGGGNYNQNKNFNKKNNAGGGYYDNNYQSWGDQQYTGHYSSSNNNVGGGDSTANNATGGYKGGKGRGNGGYNNQGGSQYYNNNEGGYNKKGTQGGGKWGNKMNNNNQGAPGFGGNNNYQNSRNNNSHYASGGGYNKSTSDINNSSNNPTGGNVRNLKQNFNNTINQSTLDVSSTPNTTNQRKKSHNIPNNTSNTGITANSSNNNLNQYPSQGFKKEKQEIELSQAIFEESMKQNVGFNQNSGKNSQRQHPSASNSATNVLGDSSIIIDQDISATADQKSTTQGVDVNGNLVKYEIDDSTGKHRQIQIKQQHQNKIIYVLDLKLQGQETAIQIEEQDNIEEIVDQLAISFKLSKEMQEALEIHIRTQLEQENIDYLVQPPKFEQRAPKVYSSPLNEEAAQYNALNTSTNIMLAPALQPHLSGKSFSESQIIHQFNAQNMTFFQQPSFIQNNSLGPSQDQIFFNPPNPGGFIFPYSQQTSGQGLQDLSSQDLLLYNKNFPSAAQALLQQHASIPPAFMFNSHNTNQFMNTSPPGTINQPFLNPATLQQQMDDLSLQHTSHSARYNKNQGYNTGGQNSGNYSNSKSYHQHSNNNNHSYSGGNNHPSHSQQHSQQQNQL